MRSASCSRARGLIPQAVRVGPRRSYPWLSRVGLDAEAVGLQGGLDELVDQGIGGDALQYVADPGQVVVDAAPAGQGGRLGRGRRGGGGVGAGGGVVLDPPRVPCVLRARWRGNDG